MKRDGTVCKELQWQRSGKWVSDREWPGPLTLALASQHNGRSATARFSLLRCGGCLSSRKKNNNNKKATAEVDGSCEQPHHHQGERALYFFEADDDDVLMGSLSFTLGLARFEKASHHSNDLR